MDDINGRIDQLLNQLSQEGLLNDQFQQLMQLQDDANPNFVKVMTFSSKCRVFVGLTHNITSFGAESFSPALKMSLLPIL